MDVIFYLMKTYNSNSLSTKCCAVLMPELEAVEENIPRFLLGLLLKHPNKTLPPPDIGKCNYLSLLVRLRSLKEEGDIADFPFIDRPHQVGLEAATNRLCQLGILDDLGLKLTELGKKVSRLPLDPRLAKVVLTASQDQCAWEVIAISAMLNVHCLFLATVLRESTAFVEFRHYEGDLFFLLNVYDAWNMLPPDSQARTGFCNYYQLNYSNLLYVDAVVQQLVDVLKCPPMCHPEREDSRSLERRLYGIKRAFLAGFCHNIAARGPKKSENYQCDGDIVTCLGTDSYFLGFNQDSTMRLLFITLQRSETNKKFNYQMKTVIRIEKDLLAKFRPITFKVKNELWQETLIRLQIK